MSVEIIKEYNDEFSEQAPYGVAILVDINEDDETEGSSEMSWFKTEAEQSAYFDAARIEYGLSDD